MLNKYIDYDYDVLYIGCRVLNNKYEFITDELIRINKAYTFHAYIIKSHYYDTILKNFCLIIISLLLCIRQVSVFDPHSNVLQKQE